MSSVLLPQWYIPFPQQHRRSFRYCGPFLRSSNGVLGIAILSFFGLILYATLSRRHNSLLSPKPSDWYGLHKLFPNPPQQVHVDSSPPVPDVLTLEQIRDIVAPTRGFFARDYSLGIGWNNVRYIMDAALLQAELLDRTLIIPSFMYARACEYESTVCADFAPLVDKNDVYGFGDWSDVVEQRMGYRISTELLLDLPRLRARHPVITISEYLRLHGRDPEEESNTGIWQREVYHAHANVFQSNKTKTPSLFVIENGWYDPGGTIRVDYIPDEMKERGRWELYSASDNQVADGHWPEAKPTNISKSISSAVGQDTVLMDWDTTRNALRSSKLEPEVDLDDDDAIERVLNGNGWEVLHTFWHGGEELDRTVVVPIKHAALRTSLRGFQDDFYHVDADVVLLAGETHLGRKVGSMRFTTDPARSRFASVVVNSFTPPQKILDLAEVLATRMRELNGGRLWMGSHMRRGDFIHAGWVMESSIEAHVSRVKDRLDRGRTLLANLGNVTAYDIEGIEPNTEQTRFPPPLQNDLFYISTDERNPEALQVIKNEGGVLLSDLLTFEDRREFGWPLVLTDVLGVLEQTVLAHSAFFYGHIWSSFAGAVINKRAARGADRRTGLLDR